MSGLTRDNRLLPSMRRVMQTRHYSRRTIPVYLNWVKRFVLFHDGRHPKEMGDAEVAEFVEALPTRDAVSAGTQNQAPAAVLFLYRHVLGVPLQLGRQVLRAKRPTQRPARPNTPRSDAGQRSGGP